jgi:putative Holliday junction resolvase
MAVHALADFRAAIAPGKRLLGLDVGDKTIGIAVADSGFSVATPVETIRRTKFAADAERLRQLIAERGGGGRGIGRALHMVGSAGPRGQSGGQFAANLLARLDIAVLFWDERLSTAAMERAMLEADVSRRRRARAVDMLAAGYILQGALDALGRRPTT